MARHTLLGFHAVRSRLRHQAGSIRELYIEAGRHDARMRELIAAAQACEVKPIAVAQQRLDAMAPGNRHQGVVAIVDAVKLSHSLDDVLDNSEVAPLVLVLDGITDPHNLGACLRVADGAGAQAVVAPKDRSCGLNATAAKVASGAAETIPFITVTNLARTLRELKDRDVTVIGTSDDTDQSIYDLDLTGPVALVMGSEGEGMRQLTRTTCDHLVRIPMAGTVESLNVSVASAICLYEAVRQRQARPSGAATGAR